MRRALVVGGSGFLGGRLLALLNDRGIGTFARNPFPGGISFDARHDRLRDLVRRLPSDLTHVFVPFGAIDMEGCARDPQGTSSVNVVAVTGVLKDAIDAGLHPVFVSTDYVFDGTRGLWREQDHAAPRMAYGAQKLAVEGWLGTVAAPWTIVRLSKVVSGDRSTHSMLGQWVNEIVAGRPQRCAADQVFSPACVNDHANAMIALAEQAACGIFHSGGPEAFTRIGLLTLLLEKIRTVDPRVVIEVSPCRLHDLPFLEKRPLDTSFDNAKIIATSGWRYRTMDDVCAEVAAAHFDGPQA
jgi:dTDP-4-dehydrorhamnose reductase